VTFGIRPEHLVKRNHPNADTAIPVTVDVIELLGNEIFVYLMNNSASGTHTQLTSRMPPDVKLERGEKIEVVAEPDKIHFFDNDTQAAIR
ncbi:MAG TPA: TOBE domain-containing protein, partial [Thermomicrobiales bacterium]|nr:TOBE domain-containing protein [Thermomicrobiales bacterium]